MYYQYLSLAKLSEYMESTLQSLYLFVNNKKSLHHSSFKLLMQGFFKYNYKLNFCKSSY